MFFVGYKVVCGFGLDYELESSNIFSLVSMVLYRLVVLCCNKAADGCNYVTTCLLLVFFVLRAFFCVMLSGCSTHFASVLPRVFTVRSCVLFVLRRRSVKTKE